MSNVKSFLTEKLLLETKFGSSCTLDVCIAGKPDDDVTILSGTVGDCLRKIESHELSYSGDEYFCLYTNLDSYCGTNLDEIAWRMGFSPDELREILRIEDTPSIEAPGKDIQILSLEECSDPDYGATVVQYKSGDLISFFFSNVSLQDAKTSPEKVVVNLAEMVSTPKPLWNSLSQRLLDTVLENPFDMYFVEYDDEDWTDEMEDVLWTEVKEKDIGGVRCGEDGARVTVYAGAMGDIDWTGHPEYGNPCFAYLWENNSLIPRIKLSLASQIQSAQEISDKQQKDSLFEQSYRNQVR